MGISGSRVSRKVLKYKAGRETMTSLHKFLLALAVAMVFTLPAMAQEVSSEAQRHMIRGEAALEEAETETDFQDAVQEFKRATQLAPNWADAWFNLGVAQDKASDFAGAINSFKKYLALSPNASDKAVVETLVIKLEYKRDKAQRVKIKEIEELPSRLAGDWCEFDEIWRCYTKIEVSGSTIKFYFLPPTGDVYLHHWGNIKGYEIKGSYFWAASDLDPNCPNLEIPMKGTVSPDAQRIELSYQRPRRYWDSSAPNPRKRCTAEGMETKKVIYLRKKP